MFTLTAFQVWGEGGCKPAGKSPKLQFFFSQKSSSLMLSGAKYRLNRLRVPQPFHWESRSPVPSSPNYVTNIYWQVWDFDAGADADVESASDDAAAADDDLCCWCWWSMLLIMTLMVCTAVLTRLMLMIYVADADADYLSWQCWCWWSLLTMLMLMLIEQEPE